MVILNLSMETIAFLLYHKRFQFPCRKDFLHSPKNYNNLQTKDIQFEIPCVNITDYRRFGYRGMMLDVSCHFFSKKFQKRYIDEMAKYTLRETGVDVRL